jgi:hypothetical protein
MTERSAGETLWLPTTMSMLVAVSQLRLELDLALRRIKSGAPSVNPAPLPAEAVKANDPPVKIVPAMSEPVPSAETVQLDALDLEPQASNATEVVEVPEVAEEDAELVAARRFAKLVATDIRLYNEDAVMAGRKEKDLANRLADQLGRGKSTFLKRHGSMGAAAVEILHQAYVEVLAAGDEEILPVSVLD